MTSLPHCRVRRRSGLGRSRLYPDAVSHLGLVAIVVRDYDEAIEFFVNMLGFELVGDNPAVTNDGRPKRWVVVRPPGGETGLLLARADSDEQLTAVGRQAAGRVGFFLHVEDFEAAYRRMTAAGVQFVRGPRSEPYGEVAVFIDIAGNKWDLIGPHAVDGALAVPPGSDDGPESGVRDVGQA